MRGQEIHKVMSLFTKIINNNQFENSIKKDQESFIQISNFINDETFS